MFPIGDSRDRLVGSDLDESAPQITQAAGIIQAQLSQLLEQRAAVMKRIAKVRRAIVGLNAIFAGADAEYTVVADEAPPLRRAMSASLIEACRSVLKNSTAPLTAIETAALLRSKHGIERKHLERSAASICRRLVAYGEATVSVVDSGRQAWAWRDRDDSPPNVRVQSDFTLRRE